MTKRKHSLIAILVWEILRIVIVFVTLVSLISQSINSNKQILYWIVSIISFQLISPLALLFLFIDWKKYQNYLNLVRVGKILNLFSLMLVFFNFEPRRVIEAFYLKFLDIPVYYFTVILLITFFDLIFLVILLSYKLNKVEKEDKDSLPRFSEVEVGERIDTEKAGGNG